MTRTTLAHYSPFGSCIQELQYAYADAGDTSKYRFGFNTQESDDEIAGEGNIYSAEFWEYDARLGRRWNLDPKPNIFQSQYAVLENNPIKNYDINGDTIKVSGSNYFIRKTNKALDKMQKTDEGKRIYDKLNLNTRVFTIRNHNLNITKTSKESELPDDWEVGDIGITGERFSNGWYMGRRGWLSLAHELAHAEDILDDKISDATWNTPDLTYEYLGVHFDEISKMYVLNDVMTIRSVDPILLDEVTAVDRENKMRAQANIPLRTHYNIIYINLKYPDGDAYVITIYTQELVKDGIGTHPLYNTNYNSFYKKKKK